MKKSLNRLLSLVLVLAIFVSAVPIVGAQEYAEAIQAADNGSVVAAIDVQPISLIEGTGGWTSTDYNPETGNYDLEYYKYDWWNYLEYTITFTDGSTYTGTGTWFEYNGEDYWIDYTDNQDYNNQWTVENTYKESISVMGYQNEVSVTIEKTPVKSIKVEPISIIEGTDGWMNTDYNPETGNYDLEYYQYGWWNDLKYTITFNDGSTCTGSGVWFWYNGEECRIDYIDNQGYNNQWTAGNAYTGSLNVMGYQTEVSVTIGKSPVKSIKVEPISFIEGSGGYMETDYNPETGSYDLEYYEYSWWNNLKYTITFTDGSTCTGTGTWFEYNGEDYNISYTDNQGYDNQWIAGNAYAGSLNVMGYQTEVSVTIGKSPVKSVKVEPISIIEGTRGWMDTDYNPETGDWDLEYYDYNWENLLKYTITFTDGSTYTGSGTWFEYNGESYGIDYTDNQGYDNQWTVGNTYTQAITVMGYQAEASVTIEKSPVKSIDVQPIYILEETDGWYNGDYYDYSWSSMLAYTITFTDGSTCTGTGTWFEYNGEEYDMSYTDNQGYYNQWTAGNTYTETINCMGVEVTVPISIYSANVENGFTYFVQNDKAFISGYTGDADTLEIPSTIGGYPVVGITGLGYDALECVTELVIPDSVTMLSASIFDCSDVKLTSLTLGSGVSNLNMGMFQYATELTNITVSKNNPYYCSVDGVVYSKDMNKLVVYPAGKSGTYTVPESVTNIDVMFDYASLFGDVSIVMGDNIEDYKQVDGIIYSSDMSTIYSCSPDKTGSYTMPDSVTEIKDYAFANSNLSDVKVSPNVTEIVYNAFAGSEQLTKVVLPESVTAISDYAFNGCSKLTDIALPGKLKTLGSSSFSKTAVKSIVIPSGVDFIGDSAFSGSALSSVVISEGVKEIGSFAFQETKLTEVAVPNSVEYMYDAAFSSCYDLKKVTLGSGLYSISTSCFEYSGLKEITLPKNIEYVDESAFANSKLESVVFENDAIEIFDNAFYNCPLKEVNLGENVTYIGQYAFSGIAAKSINLPESVTDIAYHSFSNSVNLESINVSDNLEYLCGTAFDGTAWYNNQPNGPVYLENYFYGYKGEMPENTELVIKEGTTLIANYALEDQYNLTSLTIPASLKGIGFNALYKCRNLKEIIIHGDNPYFTFEDGVLYDENGYIIWSVSQPLGAEVVYDGLPENEFGAPLDLSLLQFYVYYSDGSTDYYEVTKDMVSGYDPMKSGVQTVTVTKGEFSASIDIMVAEPDVSRIYIETAPNTVDYALNQSLRTTGMVVKAVSSNGTSFEVTDYTVTGYQANVAGSQTITVEYLGFTDTFTVNVNSDLKNFSTKTKIEVNAPVDSIDSEAKLITNETEISNILETVPELFKDNSSVVYDIYFEKDNEIVQPKETVTVYIPVPDNMAGNCCNVYNVTGSGDVIDMSAVYEDGYMVFETNHFSYYALVEEGRLGDANGDGNVNISDAVIIARAAAGLTTLSESAEALSDVSGDGNVNISDAVLIARYGAGLIEKFPAS